MSEPTLGDFLDAVIERLEPGETAEATYAPPLASWVTVCKDRLSVRWDVVEGHSLPPEAVGSWADGLVRELRMRQERWLEACRAAQPSGERLINRLVADINAARREESRTGRPRVIFVSIAARTKGAILREADDYLLPDPKPADGTERIAGAPLELDPDLCEGWRIIRRRVAARLKGRRDV